MLTASGKLVALDLEISFYYRISHFFIGSAMHETGGKKDESVKGMKRRGKRNVDKAGGLPVDVLEHTRYY